MMYEQMIEQWEDDRSLYVEWRNELLQDNEFGSEWQALNIRIAMIDEFLAFLKRCAAREVEIQEAEACDYKIKNLRETKWNQGACRVLERFYGSGRFSWKTDGKAIEVSLHGLKAADYHRIMRTFE